jgi:3-oxoacyl-[acyl-carrier protein] reductase
LRKGRCWSRARAAESVAPLHWASLATATTSSCIAVRGSPTQRESSPTCGASTDIEVHGAYYGIVCNAGLAHDTAFPAMSGDAWDSVIRTNLDAFYNVLQPVVMPMVRRRAPGRIVTLSSVSGLIGNRGQVNYSAAKAGVIGATKALAVELAKRAITVNCVAPGLIETDMASEHAPVEEILKAVPAQRMGTPDEVAAVVSFLMSAGAAYVTRQVIAVNGGLC